MSRHFCLMVLPHQRSYKFSHEEQSICLRVVKAPIKPTGHELLPLLPHSPSPHWPWAQKPHCSWGLDQATVWKRAARSSGLGPALRPSLPLMSCASPELGCSHVHAWPFTSPTVQTFGWPCPFHHWPTLLLWLGDSRPHLHWGHHPWLLLLCSAISSLGNGFTVMTSNCR